MGQNSTRLMVFFEEPFWVGILERVSDGKLSVCKITFGAEPKDQAVYDFLLKEYNHLSFSSAIDISVKASDLTPKQLQKQARKQLTKTGVGTKSQQALQMQREQMKTERKQRSKEQKEAEKQRLFELKQQKRKEKHRGR